MRAEQTTSKDDQLATFDRRISVLEARTEPKPKSLVERITAWGGVATFCLAVLYTFPLGVWEKFWVSPVTAERELIVRLTDIDTEMFKALQSMPPDQRTAVGLAMRSKKSALLLPNKELIEHHKGPLTGAELELLAYHAQSIGDIQFANELYAEALNKALKDKNKFFEAEIYRMQAGLKTMQDPIQNLPQARVLYSKAMQIFFTLPASQSNWVLASMAMEWAMLEHLAGSRSCEGALAHWGISLMENLDAGLATTWAAQVRKANGGEVPDPAACMEPTINPLMVSWQGRVPMIGPPPAPR